MEVHAPSASGSSSPVYAGQSQSSNQFDTVNTATSRHSRRPRRSSSGKKDQHKEPLPPVDVPLSASVQSNLSDSLRSSLTNSVSSSLSSNDGDLGFSEK